MKTTYQISGLKCQGCVNTVTEKLSSIKGVEDVQVNLAEKTVSFKGKVWKWRLNNALKGSKFKIENRLD